MMCVCRIESQKAQKCVHTFVTIDLELIGITPSPNE